MASKKEHKTLEDNNNNIVYYSSRTGYLYTQDKSGKLIKQKVTGDDNRIDKYKASHPKMLEEVTVYPESVRLIKPFDHLEMEYLRSDFDPTLTESNLKHRAKVKKADALVANSSNFEDILGLMNFLSPSQIIGGSIDAYKGKKNFFRSVLDGNSGFVSDNFAINNPKLATAINIVGDLAVPIGLKYKSVNTARKSLARAMGYKSVNSSKAVASLVNNEIPYPHQVLPNYIRNSYNNYINKYGIENDPIRNIIELGMYSSSGIPSIGSILINGSNIIRKPSLLKKGIFYPFIKDKSLKNKIANEWMDFFNYNGLLAKEGYKLSEAGFNPIRAGLYNDFGEMTPYVRDIKPGDLHYNWAVMQRNNPNIKIVDAPYSSTIRTDDDIKALGRNYALEGFMNFKEGYNYDAGGHFGKFSLDDTFRESDVFKFNVKDYMKKWIEPDGNRLSKLVHKKLLKIVDDRFKDFVYQTQPSLIIKTNKNDINSTEYLDHLKTTSITK